MDSGKDLSEGVSGFFDMFRDDASLGLKRRRDSHRTRGRVEDLTIPEPPSLTAHLLTPHEIAVLHVQFLFFFQCMRPSESLCCCLNSNRYFNSIPSMTASFLRSSSITSSSSSNFSSSSSSTSNKGSMMKICMGMRLGLKRRQLISALDYWNVRCVQLDRSDVRPRMVRATVMVLTILAMALSTTVMMTAAQRRQRPQLQHLRDGRHHRIRRQQQTTTNGRGVLRWWWS